MFLLSKLFWVLARPSSLMLGLMVAGTAWRRRLAGALCLALGCLALLAAALLPFGWWLAHPLENRFAAVPLPAAVDGIILLGGAVEPDLTAARGQPQVNAGAERMDAFAALARRYPGARLLFTGGRGELDQAGLSEADVTRRVFAQIGFDRPVEYEDRSRTTRENATALRTLARPRPDQRWLLVTSALHMPRAIGLFRGAGWRVIAAPAGFVTGGWRLEYEKGLPRKLLELDAAAHEWIGLAAARLMGQTDSWFPAPGPDDPPAPPQPKDRP